MDAEEFRKEVALYSTPLEELVERLLSRMEQLERDVKRLERENKRLKERLSRHEPVTGSGETKESPDQLNYSLGAELKRRGGRQRRKKSPGRRPNRIKFDMATEFRDIRPDGVPESQQRLVRRRTAWRLIDNKAVLVGYSVYGAKGVSEPGIPGLMPRGEHGVEIVVVLAFLVYVVRMSQAKACSVLRFFCGLPLSTSQADSLLFQLGRIWDAEFDSLCDLLVRAAVVYMDETGWKIGAKGCSLRAFASEAERVFLFGCRKDADMLDTVLPPDLFQGIGVSDDAAVYEFLRLALAEELFTFVLHPDVDATNNRSERNLRDAAGDRAAGRTNKSAAGAHRRSVIVSVRESLRAQWERFTQQTVLDEIATWADRGISRFRKKLADLLATEATPLATDTG